MKTTVFTKNGKVVFDTDQYTELYIKENPLRVAVKSVFEDWVNQQDKNFQNMYSFPDGVFVGNEFLNYNEVIAAGIDFFVNYVKENNIKMTSTKILLRIGITEAFEPDYINELNQIL